VAYRTPVFNLWAEILTRFGTSVGWTRCQLRGPTNTPLDLEQSDQPPSCRIVWELLVPPGSDIRTRNCSGVRGPSDWDQVWICGSSDLAFIVQAVGDKGAGFDNEYRLCYITPNLDYVISISGLPRVNPSFEPPMGYTPLPVLLPVV